MTDKKPGRLSKFKKAQWQAFFGLMGVADLILAFMRYPQYFPVGLVLDITQGVFGFVSIVGFVATSICYEDYEPAPAPAAEAPKA